RQVGRAVLSFRRRLPRRCAQLPGSFNAAFGAGLVRTINYDVNAALCDRIGDRRESEVVNRSSLAGRSLPSASRAPIFTSRAILSAYGLATKGGDVQTRSPGNAARRRSRFVDR